MLGFRWYYIFSTYGSILSASSGAVNARKALCSNTFLQLAGALHALCRASSWLCNLMCLQLDGFGERKRIASGQVAARPRIDREGDRIGRFKSGGRRPGQRSACAGRDCSEARDSTGLGLASAGLVTGGRAPWPRASMWVVGATGFEPATSSSRTKRATKLRHAPTSHAV